MNKKIGSALQAALASALHQVAWGAAFASTMNGAGIRFRCKRDANAAAADPWATGTEFLNVGMSGSLVADQETGEINLGKLTGVTTRAAADLSTGVSVFRVESGSYYIQGTIGLTGSGCDLILSANPTATTGIAISGAKFRPPSELPINGNAVSVGGTITNVAFQNTTASPITNQPVTFGQVFKRGTMPATGAALSLVGGTTLTTQMDVKATHPDGSVRHAIISAVVPSIAASSTDSYNLVRASAGTPAPAVPADFPGLDAVASIVENGTTYSASLATGLLGTYQTWLAGDVASEWIVHMPLKTGGNVSHPSIEARFEVRAYKGQAKARVAISIENSKITPGVTTQKTLHYYDVTLSVGGVQILSKTNLTHFPYTRFRKSAWWGTAPVANVKQNTAYIIATKAVPNYDPTLIGLVTDAFANAVKTNIDAAKDPFQTGIALSYMPTTGGRPDVGIIPGWDVNWLLTMDARHKYISELQSDLMGSWEAIVRDSTTGQPYNPTDYANNVLPKLETVNITGVSNTNPAVVTAPGHKFKTGMKSLVENVVGISVNALYDVGAVTANTFELVGANKSDPVASGTYTSGGTARIYNHNVIDKSHRPGAGYIPYMLTGDLGQLEILQFYAKDYSNLQHGDQLRGQAWGLRTLGHAAYITPDADHLKARFTALVDSNMDDYNARYTNNSSANSLGVVIGGSAWSDEDGTGLHQRPWQEDFLTQSVGLLAELGFTKAKAFFAYKARYPISRILYCRMLTCGYRFQLRAAGGATAPYTTIAQIMAATYPPNFPSAGNDIMAQVFNSAAMATQAGPVNYETIGANGMLGYANDPVAFVANLQPALAYAVTHGATDAATAWASYDARPVKQNYDTNPQFAIVPRSA